MYEDNDLTPLIEAGEKHLKGFLEYQYPKWLFCPSCPYKYAAIMIKPEFWSQYLERAISIVYESNDMEEFNAKLNALEKELPDDCWRNDIVL